MNKKPKFSIIVPVYNVEAYLSYCLTSLMEQTLKDIEIICVNDGSTDNSLKILQAYAEVDDRIIIIDKLNGGSSSARNAALKVAGGEYIIFVDSDDIISRDTCDRLYREVLQKNPDMIVFGTNIFPETIMAPDRGWLEWALQVNPVYYEKRCINALFWERASKPFVLNKCIKNKVLKKNNILFDEKVVLGEDMLFLFTVFPRIKNVSYIPDRLYQYRYVREGSLMDQSRKNIDWKIRSHFKLIKKVLFDWDEHGFIRGNEESLYIWCLDLILNEIDAIPDKKVKTYICHKLKLIINTYHLKPQKKTKYIKELESKLRQNGKTN